VVTSVGSVGSVGSVWEPESVVSLVGSLVVGSVSEVVGPSVVESSVPLAVSFVGSFVSPNVPDKVVAVGDVAVVCESDSRSSPPPPQALGARTTHTASIRNGEKVIVTGKVFMASSRVRTEYSDGPVLEDISFGSE